MSSCNATISQAAPSVEELVHLRPHTFPQAQVRLWKWAEPTKQGLGLGLTQPTSRLTELAMKTMVLVRLTQSGAEALTFSFSVPFFIDWIKNKTKIMIEK